MEYIKKEELKNGDVFVVESSYNFINKEGTPFSIHKNKRTGNTIFCKNGGFMYENIRLATSEEKHWLESCITADKFITYEEAMKTFIPEYVECIKEEIYNFYGKLGTIYEVENWNYSQNDCWLKGTTSGSTDRKRFKPSTKEAYDAQFIVKEPEFVLPEKWCVLRNLDNYSIINNWFLKNQTKNWVITENKGYLYSTILNGHWIMSDSNKEKDYTEITFEQFKQFVLKEETAIEFGNKIDKEIIESLPQFKVIETIETITKVENNEGNQFFIGDVVKSSNGTIQTIESFDYNKAKTNIIAFTNKQSILGNGIGIDKIEHYIESKVEVKDDFVLSKNWYIIVQDKEKEIESYRKYFTKETWIYDKGYVYGFANDKQTSGEKYGQEITFDQFQKYVLKTEVKEETLLEKDKRLYPIGTRFHAARGSKGEYIVRSDSKFRENNDGAICIQDNGNGTIYFEDEWGEIIK
jgi:hypothetical protein